jgi:hypothetical protein
MAAADGFEDLTGQAKDDDINELTVLTAIDNYGVITWEEFQNNKIFSGLSSSQPRIKALGTVLKALRDKGYVELDKKISPTAHKITKSGSLALIRLNTGQSKEAQKEDMDMELTETTIAANKHLIQTLIKTANRALTVSVLSLIVAAAAVVISLKPPNQNLFDWLRSLLTR